VCGSAIFFLPLDGPFAIFLFVTPAKAGVQLFSCCFRPLKEAGFPLSRE